MTGKTTKAFASHAKDAQWEKGLRPYFAYRDLGVKECHRRQGAGARHSRRSSLRGPHGLPLPRPGLSDELLAQGLGAARL